MQSAKGIILDHSEVRHRYDAELRQLERYRHLADYLSGAQLYLKDNFLLEEPLKPEHIKTRLLGHWGTCPGINFVYSHLSFLIKNSYSAAAPPLVPLNNGPPPPVLEPLIATRTQPLDMMFIVGPGHGAPAVISNLWLEGTLQHYYPDLYPVDTVSGLGRVLKGFSWPGGGFPSHVNAQLPGAIHEGGELGYSLSAGFGAAFDRPEVIVAVLVGDGEAETGPMATSWHGHKFVDTATSGAVLPILHLNGYKISSSTIYGRMNHEELRDLFAGRGYDVRFVEDFNDIDADMAASLEWAVGTIRALQTVARATHAAGERGVPSSPGASTGAGPPTPPPCVEMGAGARPRWPMIILRTPKGWGGPRTNPKGDAVEGTWRSHGIPIKFSAKAAAAGDAEALASMRTVEKWLRSYHVAGDLIRRIGENKIEISPALLAAVLPGNAEYRLGRSPYTNPEYVPLNLPDPVKFLVDTADMGDRTALSPTRHAADTYLSAVATLNPGRFRIFSPDELESNLMSANGLLGNLDGSGCALERWRRTGTAGCVIETLSEHNCAGWLHGYAATGRMGILASYESFLGIVATMAVQYSKWLTLAHAKEGTASAAGLSPVPTWRNSTPAVTYLATSTLWRQEHNGFSHQVPMMIDVLSNLHGNRVRLLFPQDANSLVLALDECLRSVDRVNLVVATKMDMPISLPVARAASEWKRGLCVHPIGSANIEQSPHAVLVGIGCETSIEAAAATLLLKRDLPWLKTRYIQVADIYALATPDSLHRHGNERALDDAGFEYYFSKTAPVIINFHGYPSVVEQLLFERGQLLGSGRLRNRFQVLGYREIGTTTTPFKLLAMNGCDRFTMAIAAIRAALAADEELASTRSAEGQITIEKYQRRISEADEYARANGADEEQLWDSVFKEIHESAAAAAPVRQ